MSHTSLSSSAQLIERELSYDECRQDESSFNTAHYIYPSISVSTSVPASASTSASSVASAFTLHTQYALPSLLVERIQQAQVTVRAGLLVSLQRAYLSVDQRFYLWDIQTGQQIIEHALQQIVVIMGATSRSPIRTRSHTYTQTRTLATHAPYADSVLNSDYSASALASDSDSDSDSNSQLLIVCTPVEIHLFTVKQVKPSPSHQPHQPQQQTSLALYPYHVLSSDTVRMTAIASTREGRIFLAGANGLLYELEIDEKESWFRNRVRLVNRSPYDPWRNVSALFNASHGRQPISQIVVDESRRPHPLLFTLSLDGSILVFSIKPVGLTWLSENRHSFDEAKKLLHTLHPNFTEDWSNRSEFCLVHIAAIPSHESQTLLLCAVTSHGHRLFYHQSDRLSVRLVRLSMPSATEPPLDTRGRPQPNNMFDPQFKQQSSPISVHCAYYKDGVALLADAQPNGGDTVIATVKDDANTTKVIETVHALALPSRIVEFSEMPLNDNLYPLSSALYARGFDVPLHGLHEFTAQHVLPPKTFLALSVNGLYGCVMRRALDDIREACERRRHTLDDSEIARFYNKHGSKEAGAMLLALICSPPALLSLSDGSENIGMNSPTKTSGFEQNTLKQARAAFIKMSNSLDQPPSISSVAPAFAPNAAPFNLAPFVRTPTLSYVVQSLALFSSRLLRPFWDWPLFIKSKQELVIRLKNAQLRDARGWLERFALFIEEHSRAFTRNEEETEIVRDLQALHFISLELLSLLDLLSLRLPSFSAQVMSALSEIDREALSSVKFYALVTGPQGSSLLQRLMHALTRVPLMSHSDDRAFKIGGLDGLSDSEQWVFRLHRACPTFFAHSDLLYYQANEAIKSASSCSGSQQEALLEEAIVHLRTAAHASTFDIEEATNALLGVKAFVAAVEVALYRAELVTRGEIVLSNSMQSPTRQKDDDLSVKKADELDKCSRIILRCLDEVASFATSTSTHYEVRAIEEARNRLLASALTSQDFNTHARIYQWLIDHNANDVLFSLSSSFLIQFLSSDNRVLLLKDYYLSNGQHADAALLLFNLAQRETAEWNLSDRIGFLARSLACARSCIESDRSLTGNPITDSEFVYGLRQDIELAQIQMQLQNHLYALSNESGLPELRESVETLNNSLLDHSALFNMACAHKAWIVCLAIVNASDSRRLDVVTSLWQNVLRNEIAIAFAKRISWPQLVYTRLQELCALYKDISSMFPLEFIVRALHSVVSEYGCQAGTGVILDSDSKVAEDVDACMTPSAWLSSCGVSEKHLIDVYYRLIDFDTLIDQYFVQSVKYLARVKTEENTSGQQLIKKLQITLYQERANTRYLDIVV